MFQLEKNQWYCSCIDQRVVFPPNLYTKLSFPMWWCSRWNLCDVIRSWGQSPPTWGVCPYKRDPGQLPHPFGHVRTQPEECCWLTRKLNITRHQICHHLDLGLLSLQNCQKYFVVVYKPTRLGIFKIKSMNVLRQHCNSKSSQKGLK